MTVGELIEKLKDFDSNMEVAAWDAEFDDCDLITGIDAGPSKWGRHTGIPTSATEVVVRINPPWTPEPVKPDPEKAQIGELTTELKRRVEEFQAVLGTEGMERLRASPPPL